MKAQDSMYVMLICFVRGTYYLELSSCSSDKTYKLNIHTILSFHLVPLTKHINLTVLSEEQDESSR
jgi:hypothetical protein